MNVPLAHALLPKLLAAGACLAVLAGCSGGSIGDPPSKPLGNQFGPGERLCKLLGPATWYDASNMDSKNCGQPQDHAVYTTGLSVVAIDDYDETGDGAVGNYWVQDPDPACLGKPFSGVTVFAPSFSPPDLRLAENDVIDINGQITEFIGPSGDGKSFKQCRTLPEITGSVSFRFDGNNPLEPVTIPVTDLKTYETGRQWIGMLVKVENIQLAGNGTGSGGRFSAPINVGGGIPAADVPKITNELYDIAGRGPELKDMGAFASVTGIVTYFYGFHISPRSPADFE
ncbi:MAG: hypothetical protein QM820_02175 [Minicystis sp.]